MAERFTVEIECGNAAFEDAPERELARILRHLADMLEDGIDQGTVADVNGNTVGRFRVTL